MSHINRRYWAVDVRRSSIHHKTSMTSTMFRVHLSRASLRLLTLHFYTPLMRYRTWRLWSASGDHQCLRHSSIFPLQTCMGRTKPGPCTCNPHECHQLPNLKFGQQLSQMVEPHPCLDSFHDGASVDICLLVEILVPTLRLPLRYCDGRCTSVRLRHRNRLDDQPNRGTQSRGAAILVERSHVLMSHRSAIEKTTYCGTRTLRQAPIQALQVSEHARPRRCLFLVENRPTGAYGDALCGSTSYKIMDFPPWALTRST